MRKLPQYILTLTILTTALFLAPQQTQAQELNSIQKTARTVFCTVNKFFNAHACEAQPTPQPTKQQRAINSLIGKKITTTPQQTGFTTTQARLAKRTQQATAITSPTPKPQQNPAPQTIIKKYITNPVVERTIQTKEIIKESGLTQEQFQIALNELRKEIYKAQASPDNSQNKAIWRAISLMNNSGSTNTDSQTLSFNSSTNALTITGGNAVDLSSLAGGGGGGTDDQTLTLSANILSIEDGNTVDLSPYLDNTDDQTLTAATFNTTTKELSITIEDGNTVTVDLTNLVNDADFSITNEIQDLALVDNDLTITSNASATTIDLSPYLDNTDTQLSETQVDTFVANNGYLTTETDDQTIDTFTLVANVISLSLEDDAEAVKTIDLTAYLDNTDTQLTEAQVDTFVANNGYLTNLNSETIQSLSNVDSASATNGQILEWNGTNWVAGDKTTDTDTTYTDAEIKTKYENNTNTNTFTDTEQSKLSGIEANATADQTGAEIESIVNHDNLQGFVASEHIDWTQAGAGTINASNYTDTNTTYTASTGLTISGTNIQPDSLYNIPLTTSTTQWATAYGWGNHASAGYLTAISTNTLTNKSGSNSMWTNDEGYITSQTDDQNISGSGLSGTTLTIGIENGTNETVDLSSLANTDAQNLSYNTSSNILSITNGSGVDLSELQDNTDEQDLSLSGNTLSLSNDVTTVDLSAYLDNTDTQLTEEQVEDFVGGMLGGTETGLLVTYQDSTNDIDFTVTGVLQDLNTLGAPALDSQFLVATGVGAFAYESGTTVRTSLGLANVENTALSTWAGSTALTTLGTISTGVWNGTAIGDAYLTKTGDWTGTFDGQEGNYYLSRANHTGTQLMSTISDAGALATLSSVTSGTITDNTIQEVDLEATNAPADNQILSYDLTSGGFTWVADQDTDTTYTASNGLSLASSVFAVNSPTCTGTDKLQWNGTVFVCTADVDTDTDTQLSETQVDTFVANNGYLTSETDNQKIDVFSFLGDTLSLSLESDGEITKTIDLSSYAKDTDLHDAITLTGSYDYITKDANQQLTLNQIDLTTDTIGTLDETNGGTGLTAYATGDILYASGVNTLAKLTAGTNGQVLKLSAGLPSWGVDDSGAGYWTQATNDIYYTTGDVSIGTNTSSSRLDIFETSSSPQMRISYDATSFAEFTVNITGDLTISTEGDDITLPDENLRVCFGGACPADSSTLAGNGNIVAENKVFAEGFEPASCPTGMIPVPASPQDGLQGFCIDKYEAKNVGGIATSQAASNPWVSITQYNARAECIQAGKHLVTEAEWLAVAHNAEDVGWNWNGGVAGTNQMSDGHSDNGPAGSLAASTDTDACSGTGQTCSDSVWSTQRRTYKLSNGEYIWDLGGNVWEWTDQVVRDDYPIQNSAAAGWQACSTAGDGVCGNTLTTNDQWFRGGTTATRGFLRGSAWTDGTGSGAFTLALNSAPTNVPGSVGFRCAR